ncbi:hypothetical protein Taro_055757 [Colocasia esculenta]|uniref:Uncharacterized protein n=1 Tax=Colocasia esculenta TaxID=4460 RepID=A0A843XUG6_COLES|nr:hypothetical protein [Colocasia esculenta]
MAVLKKGTCALLARPFRVAVRCKQLVASFSAGSECDLQESVVAVAGCACFEHGCCFARAAVGFVFSLGIRVGVLRRLREPACGVAFTGAGLFPVDLVEGSCLVRCPLIVRFPRTVGCCPGEVRSQDCSGLVSADCCATSGLRYAVVTPLQFSSGINQRET